MTDALVHVRERMVQEQVRARGIQDERVIEAMRRIPRHLFVEPGLAYRSYEDRPLPIGQGQTISQPYVVAYMTEQLRLEKSHRVLEVGTGSGYQTALLAALGGQVYTIERVAALQNQARRVLTRLHYANVRYHLGDGASGWPEPGTFDRILMTAAAPEIPVRLVGQLAEGGRLLGPLGNEGEAQELMLAIKHQGRLRRRRLQPCTFVPLLARGP